MPENNGRELLLHGLKDMYDAEHKFADALRKAAEKTKDRTLADGLRRHREVTQGQIQRLEECFEEMGERPQREECAGAAGLIEEYSTFVQKERPDPQTHDLFAAGANLKVEHYEIAAYATMVDLALRLDESQAANLLTENLREEEATAAELEMASRKLGAALTGSSAGLRGAVDTTVRAPMRSGGLGAVARAVGNQAGDMVGRLEKRGRRARTGSATGKRSTSGRSTARASSKSKRSATASTSNGRRSTTGRRRAVRGGATARRERTTSARSRSTSPRGSATTRSSRRPASRSGGARSTARRRTTAGRGGGTRGRGRSSR